VRGQTAPRGSIGHALREGGRVVEARTRYRRRGTWAGHTMLEVTPEQDRPHQIEKHLADIGHPVLGDERHGHGPTNRHFAEKYWLDRPFLHLHSITLTPPGAGAPLTVTCPLPADLPPPEGAKPGLLR